MNPRYLKYIIGIVIAFFLTSLLTTCVRVEAGYVAVKVSKYGDDQGVDLETKGPGIHWGSYNTSFHKFPTFTQNVTYTSEGGAFAFQTKEGMKVATDVGLSFSVPAGEAAKVFQKYRRGVVELTDTYLRNMVRDALNVAGSTIAVEDAYGEGKAAFIASIEKSVSEQAAKVGVLVEKVFFVNDLKLPNEVVQSINAKMAANQKAAQKQNEKAQAEADAAKVVATAQGDKDAAILRAEGEAEALNKIGEALRKNSDVVQLKAIEKWKGEVPQYMGGNAPIPFMNIK